MAIKIKVTAPMGAGKSHLIRIVVEALKREGYHGAAVYSNGSVDGWKGDNGIGVVIEEINAGRTDA